MAVFEELPDFASMSMETLKDYWTAPERDAPETSMMRSALMVRADMPKHLNKLDRMQADIAVINLEDGIAPEKKEWAAHLAGVFLSRLRRSHAHITVRVNPLDLGGDEEISFFNRFKPDAIRIPKIRTPKEVEHALNLADTDIDLHLTIETKEAFGAIGDLKLDKRVRVFYFGVLDLLSDMGLPQSMVTLENPLIEYLRTRFLAETCLAGGIPMGFVYQDFQDLKTFRQWCEKDKAIGFAGKGCISPKQVEVANTVFGLDETEIEKARYIKARFEEESRNGNTGFADEKYGFIDEPIYRDALLRLKSSY